MGLSGDTDYRSRSAKMGKPESDEKELLEESSKDVTIHVQENPPPYQYQQGQRVYPTNRAYNWFCERGSSPYAHGNQRDERQSRRSGCALLFLAIPAVLLMSLGIYLLTTMLLWCPTCGHHKGRAVHTITPETQIKSPNERLDAKDTIYSPFHRRLKMIKQPSRAQKV